MHILGHKSLRSNCQPPILGHTRRPLVQPPDLYRSITDSRQRLVQQANQQRKYSLADTLANLGSKGPLVFHDGILPPGSNHLDTIL
jgi:hypothetical protein